MKSEFKMSLKQESLDKDVSVDINAAASELTIDPAAEKKLVRKLDLWLSPMMVLVFLVSYLDRSNIGERLRAKFCHHKVLRMSQAMPRSQE